MGFGVSIFLLAVGAILAFAVEMEASGIDINTVGVILMLVGAIGLLASMFFWDRMGFGGDAGYGRRDVVVDRYRDEVPAGRRVVRERRVVEDDVV
jgi:hypothetical protein